MKLLRKYFKQNMRDGVLAPALKLCEALMDLLVPLVIAEIINKGIVQHNMHLVAKYFVLLLVLAALGLIFSVSAQYMAAKFAVGYSTKLRQFLFDHIQGLSYTELDTLGTDTLITRMTSDINQVQNGINLALRLVLRSPFIVFGSMIMAFTINVKAALVFLVTIPVLSVVVFGIMLGSVPLYKKSQTALDHLTGVTRENLAGVRVIRAFCKEQDEIHDFDNKNEALTRMNEIVGRVAALMNPLTFLIINVATIILIYVGAIEVNAGGLLQGDVVALYNYMAQILVELVKLANLIININRAMACSERIDDIFRVKSDMAFPEETTEPKEDNDICVAFDHVTFGYKGSGDASLSDISFQVPRGATVGIIGGTGSGKSTLANLIPRFYDTSSGSVYVDGRNVRDYADGELIDKIGVVPQKAVLFEGTIRDNLKWGNQDADDEQLWEAIRTAQAEEVVENKERKLDERIEQNGQNFSGGQKQRLTIARALVKKPEILILDDSSSALDFATDRNLRIALHKLSGKMTTFIVSQRAASIKMADMILVLNDGELVGEGKHEELMKDCEVYQEIYYSQFPEAREEETA
ncbi:MAG: ABC transporter ATP-binding protein [Lachnospiraceae bacterium]|nr:ABC transporter ATP-binding protein [Lachnospiraceae bacterium]